jgi:glycosyltransferase involved in cell wall biosynthesis
MVENSENPLVSILIPTYNRENLIGKAIESALNQTYKNIEIIIGDNNSSDKTAEVVKSHSDKDSRIKFFQNEKNLGPVLNWERCLNEASGEYSKILWSDDLMNPKFLESTLALFEKEKNLAFVFTKVFIGQDPADSKGSECYDYFAKTGIFEAREFSDGVINNKILPRSPGCAIFKTEVLKKSFIKTNELFENKYLQNGAGPDLLMFLMATKIHKKIGYVNSNLSFFKAHPDSISTLEESNLDLFYKKAVVWFIYHEISKNFANAYYLKTKESFSKSTKISESFDLNPEFVRSNLIVTFYTLKISFLKSRFFKSIVKILCSLIPSKELRRKIRKNLL